MLMISKSIYSGFSARESFTRRRLCKIFRHAPEEVGKADVYIKCLLRLFSESILLEAETWQGF